MKTALASLFLLLATWLPAVLAQEARTALLIGCDYTGSALQLPSPAQDARALRASSGKPALPPAM